MSKDHLYKIALEQMPKPPVEIVPNSQRWDVIDGLTDRNNLGIELGVAAGSFSSRMVQSGKFRRFWGVDVYSDIHDITEYKRALVTVGIEADYSLLRMTFDEALDLFPDEFFDFIYVDGYAHTGEEGGRTLINWYAKLKPGGIFAGDDYDFEKWPLVVWAVNDLANQLGVMLNITDQVANVAYNKFRSWYFTRPMTAPDSPLRYCEPLVEVGDVEKLLRSAARRKS